MHFFSENAYALLLLLLLFIDIVHLYAPLTECRPCVCDISGSGAVGILWQLLVLDGDDRSCSSYEQ